MNWNYKNNIWRNLSIVRDREIFTYDEANLLKCGDMIQLLGVGEYLLGTHAGNRVESPQTL